MPKLDYKNLDKVITAYAKYVVQQSKSNLTKDKKGGGDLYNSISYDLILEEKAFLLDFLMQDYGQFVDKGVKGKSSTYPETRRALSKFQYGSGRGIKGGLTKGIGKWLRKKRFQWRDEKGRFMSYQSMQYLIVKSIYNKGLKANMFFSKPFQKGLEKYSNDFFDAFILDVEQNTIFGESN